MATTGAVFFRNYQGDFIAAIHKYGDGHPEYLGKELLKCTEGKFTTGVPIGAQMGEAYNGIGCFVASVVSTLKTSVGSVYLMPDVDDYDDCFENYIYEVVENSERDGVEVFVLNQEKEWEFVSEILERTNQLYQND